MEKVFIEKLGLEGPIVGVAPMDGVTDAAFRHMVVSKSCPSFVMTEFTNVEGLARGAVEMLKAFIYEENERPIIAQIYGVEIESFYKSALMLCHMGFDGIDINMGCPVNKVARQGSGAGLIKTPDRARKIIRSVKKAVKDFSNGMTMEKGGVHADIIKAIKPGRGGNEITVSVKTRIGFDKDISVEWTKILMEEEPDNIFMHGRTLKQLYYGEADWEALARAALVTKNSGTSFMGNGDISSMKDARARIKKYGVDGVLVGRALMGNPWFFCGKEPAVAERLEAAKEHAVYMEENVPEIPFIRIRKHLGAYCKGFDGAKELRMKFMKVEKASDVANIVNEFNN